MELALDRPVGMDFRTNFRKLVRGQTDNIVTRVSRCFIFGYANGLHADHTLKFLPHGAVPKCFRYRPNEIRTCFLTALTAVLSRETGHFRGFGKRFHRHFKEFRLVFPDREHVVPAFLDDRVCDPRIARPRVGRDELS